MQYNEYMRRKVQSMNTVIGLPKLGDQSLYTQVKRFQASGYPVSKKSGGQSSSDNIAAAGGRALCCSEKKQYPLIESCCPLSVDIGTATPTQSLMGIKPQAYYSTTCTPCIMKKNKTERSCCDTNGAP
jgi:hypothetical protein